MSYRWVVVQTNGLVTMGSHSVDTPEQAQEDIDRAIRRLRREDVGQRELLSIVSQSDGASSTTVHYQQTPAHSVILS